MVTYAPRRGSLNQETDNLSEWVDDPDFPNSITLQQRTAAPARVRTGMIVLADGVLWNPGAGAGFYGYYAGAWAFLG
jgi:hypothetical protein